MSAAYSEDDLKRLVALTIEIAALRFKLSHVRATIHDYCPSAMVDDDGEDLIEHALASDQDLATILNFLTKRLNTPGEFGALVAQPLNRFEQAHLDAARKNAKWIDSYCAKKAH